jgi:hypothetical protein
MIPNGRCSRRAVGRLSHVLRALVRPWVGLFVAFLATQKETRIRWFGEPKEKGRLLNWPMRIAIFAFGAAVALAAVFGWL